MKAYSTVIVITFSWLALLLGGGWSYLGKAATLDAAADGWENLQTYYCYVYPPNSDRYARLVVNYTLRIALRDACRFCAERSDLCASIKCVGRTIFDEHLLGPNDCRTED